MEAESLDEPEEEATPRDLTAPVASTNASGCGSWSVRLADKKLSSCGCGFDGIIRYGYDMLSSIRGRGLIQGDTTSLRPRWEWLQRPGFGDYVGSRCASAVCVGSVINRRDEADITEHREQLKEQAKESLLRAHQAEHDFSVLEAHQKDTLAKLAATEKDLEMANRKIEIAEQDKEKRLRQLEEDLSRALKEKQQMQSDMGRRQKELIRERDEALREKASLERPQWRRLLECQGKIPGFPPNCCLDSTYARRIMRQCSPIDKLMHLVCVPKLRSWSSCLDCFPSNGNVRNLPEGEHVPQLQRTISYDGDELRPQSNPYRDSGRIDLINALLKSEWSYVSEWFEQQMRDVVEPLLQEQLASYSMKIKIGHTCDLGDTPVQLQNIVAETCTEVMPDGGERIENLQIVGNLDYHGNAMVDVDVSGLGVSGSLFVTGLKVQGSVVIELVKLTHEPPWFSGVRIFFPNAPKVDINLNTKLRLVGSIEALGTVIRDKIVQALDEKVLGRKVVLPNRFCIGLGERMEDVSLRHPRPQGVLRLAVLRAQGLRNTRSGSNWYWPFSKKTADDENVNPYAVLTLGAESKQTHGCTKTLSPKWENQMFDFIVTDFAKQSLRLTVRDHESGLFSTSDHLLGSREVPLAELTKVSAQQQGICPQERWISLYSETGWLRTGYVMIQAQWRPFARVNEITQAVTALDNWWGLGVRSEVCWLLAADIFYASGLPHCEEGTEHWATMTISGFRRHDAPDVPQTKDTPVAYAADPIEHGLKMLGNIGLEKGVMPDEDRRQVGRTMWRKKVILGAKAADLEKKETRFVDVVWNSPLLFLMDRVQDVRVKVSVWRPAKGGKIRPPPGTAAIEIGSFEHTLNMAELGGRMILNLHPALGESCAEMKLRLQASPLLAPSSSCKMDRNLLAPYSQRLGQAANAFCANRSLSVDFSNPEAARSISFAPDLPFYPEGGEACIEGVWSGGSIAGTLLSWNDGADISINMVTPKKFTVILGDDLVTAVLKDDGKLHWSDGDVWERKVEDSANEDTVQAAPQQSRRWFNWGWPRSAARAPAPALEMQADDNFSPINVNSASTSVTSPSTAARWTWFRSPPLSRDRAQSAMSCMDSDDERELAHIFAENSDLEDQEELSSVNAVPQLSRLERFRSWWYPSKSSSSKSVELHEDQTLVEIDSEWDFQRQTSDKTACSYVRQASDTTVRSYVSEARAQAWVAAHETAEPHISQEADKRLPVEENKTESRSSWRIVNWWNSKRKSGSDEQNQENELAMLRQNYSAPELTVQVLAEEIDLDTSGSSWEVKRPSCDMINSRQICGMKKRAVSDPNLVATEEESSKALTTKDDLSILNQTDQIRAPHRRHWLGFRQTLAPSVDTLSGSNNSTFPTTMLSDSYASALQTPALLSPKRGMFHASGSVTSAPEDIGNNEDSHDIGECELPVFTGKDTPRRRSSCEKHEDSPQEARGQTSPPSSSRSHQDVSDMHPSAAEFGTPDPESKVEGPESTSPIKAVLSYFRKR